MTNTSNSSAFSEIALKKLHEISTNQTAYTDFLKFQGRLFKHTTSATLEVFAQNPQAEFVGDKEHWASAKCTIKTGSIAIRFTDKEGNVHDYFAYSQVVGKRPWHWTLSHETEPLIRENMGIPENESLIKGLLAKSHSSQIGTYMEQLGIPMSQGNFNEFSRCFYSAVATIIAGRFEVGTSSIGITPDLSVIEKLPSAREKLGFLTLVANTAKAQLWAIEEIARENETRKYIERTEENGNNELQGVANANTAGTERSGGITASVNSEGGTTERNLRGEDNQDGRGLDVGTHDGGSGNRTDFSDVQGSERSVAQIRPNLGNLQHELDGIGSANDDTATREVRETLGGDDGGDLSRNSGGIATETSLSDDSTASREVGEELRADLDKPVQTAKSTEFASEFGAGHGLQSGDVIHGGGSGDEGYSLAAENSALSKLEEALTETAYVFEQESYFSEPISNHETYVELTSAIEAGKIIVAKMAEKGNFKDAATL
jgi:hypothetical protein